MKHFRKIRSNVPVDSFVRELKNFQGSWGTVRAQKVQVQKETLDIPLRIGISEIGKKLLDSHKSMRTEWYSHFPQLTEFLESLETELGAKLSRAMIVSLQPKGKVYSHRDDGEYYKIRDRYHLVLYSEGSRMIIEDEEILFKPGELWWYDNKGYHESYNESDKERIHVIFDMLPWSWKNRFLVKLRVLDL